MVGWVALVCRLSDCGRGGIAFAALAVNLVTFERESCPGHPNSTNRLLFVGALLVFDAISLVPELVTQPLQVIVGGHRGPTGQ